MKPRDSRLVADGLAEMGRASVALTAELWRHGAGFAMALGAFQLNMLGLSGRRGARTPDQAED